MGRIIDDRKIRNKIGQHEHVYNNMLAFFVI